MNLNLQRFKPLLSPVSLALVILEMLPKYGNTIWSSNLGTVANILFRNFGIQQSTNFVE